MKNGKTITIRPSEIFRKTKNILCISILFALFSCSSQETPTSKKPSELWGNLTTGEYQIGFKTMFLYDLARPAVPYSDWNGKLYPLKATKGRQMQINIWYPAKVTPSSKRLTFEHYLNLLSQQTDFSPINRDKKDFAVQEFINKTNMLGGNGAFTKEKLNILSKMETNAFLEAQEVKKQFPLIVFPNGGSPAFQSIMCEYFASHGFIVAAMPLKGQYSFTDEASVRGIESTVDDLDFALRNLLQIPEVNREKIGMIGNAITSSQIVAYKSRNNNIDCIISLEGGLLSSFEQSLLKKTAFYEEETVDVPIMAIYAPHPAIKPSFISHLKFSQRYFLHFPQMTEFHFLNYGMLEKFVPGIIGNHEGDKQQGFEWGSKFSLKFFEAYLEGNNASLEFLKNGVPDEAKNHIDSFFVQEALPLPPNISEVKNAFIRNGFQYIDSVYESHKSYSDNPFSMVFYNDLKDWLAWQKDPEYDNRFKLYQLAYDSYPESSRVNYYLAYFAAQKNQKSIALKHFKEALRLLPKDEDPDLRPSRKDRMKDTIMKEMKELNN